MLGLQSLCNLTAAQQTLQVPKVCKSGLGRASLASLDRTFLD